MPSPVSNQSPARESGYAHFVCSYRIAFVGEAPGVDEERLGVPFIGASGRLLNALLSSVGLSREACFVGNVCQHRPPGNLFAAFAWEGAEIQRGIACLLEDLQRFAPNVVVCLGNAPLHLLKHGNVTPERNKAGEIQWRSSVSKWRGSLFLSSEMLTPTLWKETATPEEAPQQALAAKRWKCLAAYHPAFVLRAWARCFDLRQDLRRAREEGASPELELPALNVAWGPEPWERLPEPEIAKKITQDEVAKQDETT